MDNKSNRRKFLKFFGISGLALGAAPTDIFSAIGEKKNDTDSDGKSSEEKSGKHAKYKGSYTGEYLNRIAFPIGGMGAGMFCIEGTGAISNMSIQNRPDVFNEPQLFAAISVKGLVNGAKVLEGPVPDWKKFGQPNSANGMVGKVTTGLPRMQSAVFHSKFPYAFIDLADEDIPLKVQLTGWSPFIPTDADNSSMPVGAIEYKFNNNGHKPIEAIFSFNTKNFLKVDGGRNSIKSFANGFILSEAGTKDKPSLQSSFAVFTDDDLTKVDHCWFRGGWYDSITMAWNAVRDALVKKTPPVENDAPGASLYIPFTLLAGQEKKIKLMFAWYSPVTELSYGDEVAGTKTCTVGAKSKYEGKYHKPWYASRFNSITEVCDYWKNNYSDLNDKTSLFREAFFSSTLPPEVVDKVAANLSILKSPTILRQYDGRLWAFEGCADTYGSSHGSCTHVWNYAQAIPHLFPSLERSLRETEFCENQNGEGHQVFRANLPIKPTTHTFHSAADGQLGGIMKVYREWRISGNNEWLKNIYPAVKISIDYCINTWDPKHEGAIKEPHHNTYDIEFWGADGMHQSFYIGALKAMIAMGKFMGDNMAFYEGLESRAKSLMEDSLYNGEYFFQKMQITGLKAENPASDPATAKSFAGGYSAEAKVLLEKEGPKYQYGSGCLSDGILGFWIGAMCGLGDLFPSQKIESHLLSVHRYNLKSNLRDHANPQRPTYALGNEGGLLLCTWPKGGKLSLPFVYSDEVWTGIEHQVASHLMIMGKVNEGLDILRLCRSRYNGKVRNPFNEYEWGHWYARALSSYGYLQALTGLRYDAVDKTLFVDSKVGDFVSFISTETGFGTVSLKGSKPSIKIVYGKIDVERVNVSGKEEIFPKAI